MGVDKKRYIHFVTLESIEMIIRWNLYVNILHSAQFIWIFSHRSIFHICTVAWICLMSTQNIFPKKKSWRWQFLFITLLEIYHFNFVQTFLQIDFTKKKQKVKNVISNEWIHFVEFIQITYFIHSSPCARM